MRLILVCGPGGSGTTAVAGALAQLGAVGFGPYLPTNDERTENCYELIPFRDILHRCISLKTLSINAGTNITSELQEFRQRVINQELGKYDLSAEIPMFLKEPLAAIVIPQICEVFETRLIFVLRPFADIDATFKRRKWGFGIQPSGVIYSHMFHALLNYQAPALIVRYPELIASPVEQVMKISEFAGLKGTPAKLLAASNFIATHSMTYRKQARA